MEQVGATTRPSRCPESWTDVIRTGFFRNTAQNSKTLLRQNPAKTKTPTKNVFELCGRLCMSAFRFWHWFSSDIDLGWVLFLRAHLRSRENNAHFIPRRHRQSEKIHTIWQHSPRKLNKYHIKLWETAKTRSQYFLLILLELVISFCPPLLGAPWQKGTNPCWRRQIWDTYVNSVHFMRKSEIKGQ